MTPKLYEEVNAKLVGVWGDFAGWAHSVSQDLPRNSLPIELRPSTKGTVHG
jgi:hypothetical protein